jgi:hypothetical protein
MNNLMTLNEVLRQSNVHRGWLYLRNEPFMLNSKCFFYSVDLALSPDEEKLVRAGFTKEGWKSTLSADDIEDVISNLEEQLETDATLDQKLTAFNFFYTNDAFIEWPLADE